jgi:hypothetical protein
MRKRKALKGGYKYTDPALAGPVLKEKLYQTPDKDITSLKSKYNEKFKEAERDLNQLIQIKKDADTNFYKKQTQELKEQSINDKASAVSNEQTKKSLLIIGKTSSAIVRAFWTFITFIVSNVKYVFTTFSKAGKGAIIKAILAILFIILFIVGAVNGFSGLNKNNMKNATNASKNIFKKDYDDYLNIQRPKNIFSSIQDIFNNLIPNSYKYKLASLSNSLTYITTGQNQYDEYLEPRIEIKNGRSDNIFHVNFNKVNNRTDINKTYSIIKPKPITLNFNENIYYDSDYNKIDSNIKAYIGNYPQKCIIQIMDDNGKYKLDLDKMNYYDNNDNIIANSNLITPIFKNSYTGGKLNTGVKLNSINNYLYTSYNNANNVLGAYATKLINPNYKGPILRLSLGSDSDETKKKTIDFYNDYNDKKLYCIIDNKKIDFDNYFTKNEQSTIDVRTLYDQSGNNKHFSYSETALIRDPRLKINNDTRDYYLSFNERRILVLSDKISYKKIKIFTKIKINYNVDKISDRTITPMHFLYRKDENFGIDIFKKDVNTYYYYYNKKYISNDIPITNKIEYITIENIENNDNDVIFESLGNSEDIRNKGDRIGDKDGETRKKNLDNNSLNADLYELRIFKSDD